jgi:anti-sigma factor (TIGR02949 family)
VLSLSREEHSHKKSEQSSDPAGAGNAAVECATVIAMALTFLDGECTDDTRAWVCRHLRACEGCVSQYAFEGRINNLIATGLLCASCSPRPTATRAPPMTTSA